MRKKNLSKLNFQVGAGAIGCELLKNLSMMGAATSKGKIHIVDMDTIETSNLNRQLLFRREDINVLQFNFVSRSKFLFKKPKAAVAEKAAKKINPSVNVMSHVRRIGEESEGKG